MSVSIFSYRGEVTVGLMVDAALIPDPDRIVTELERELSAFGRHGRTQSSKGRSQRSYRRSRAGTNGSAGRACKELPRPVEVRAHGDPAARRPCTAEQGRRPAQPCNSENTLGEQQDGEREHQRRETQAPRPTYAS